MKTLKILYIEDDAENRSDLIEEKDNTETSDEPYYLNDETRQIAQEAFENLEYVIFILLY